MIEETRYLVDPTAIKATSISLRAFIMSITAKRNSANTEAIIAPRVPKKWIKTRFMITLTVTIIP